MSRMSQCSRAISPSSCPRWTRRNQTDSTQGAWAATLQVTGTRSSFSYASSISLVCSGTTPVHYARNEMQPINISTHRLLLDELRGKLRLCSWCSGRLWTRVGIRSDWDCATTAPQFFDSMSKWMEYNIRTTPFRRLAPEYLELRTQGLSIPASNQINEYLLWSKFHRYVSIPYLTC
jgi:hypothetical protein